MRKSVFAIAFLAVTQVGAPPHGVVADAGALDGYYTVSGTESNGKKYNSVATVMRRGDSYMVFWHMGEMSTVGIGLRQSNTLSVGWTMAVEGKLVRGATQYKITNENGVPKLTGRWLSTAAPITSSETLTFMKALANDD